MRGIREKYARLDAMRNGRGTRVAVPAAALRTRLRDKLWIYQHGRLRRLLGSMSMHNFVRNSSVVSSTQIGECRCDRPTLEDSYVKVPLLADRTLFTCVDGGFKPSKLNQPSRCNDAEKHCLRSQSRADAPSRVNVPKARQTR